MVCKNLEESYSEFFKALKVKFYEKYKTRVIKGVSEEKLLAERKYVNELIDKLLEDVKTILFDGNIKFSEEKITKSSLLILICDFLELYKEFFIDEEFDIFKKFEPLKINNIKYWIIWKFSLCAEFF